VDDCPVPPGHTLQLYGDWRLTPATGTAAISESGGNASELSGWHHERLMPSAGWAEWIPPTKTSNRSPALVLVQEPAGLVSQCSAYATVKMNSVECLSESF
jgi:hypothetical protein